MPVVKLQSGSLMPAGEHILTLTEVNEVESPNPFKQKPTDPDTRIRWAWKFESESLDEDGVPFVHTEWTGTQFGNSRANLTTLLRQVVPGITKEAADHLNTDTLLGKRFRAHVRHGLNQKNETVSELAVISPMADSSGAKQETGKKKKDEIPF